MVVDTHIHSVFDVDDGARDINEALGMIKLDKEQGANIIICTPHNSAFDFDRKSVIQNFKQLKGKAREENIKLYLGCEIYCTLSNIEDVIWKLKHKIYLTTNFTEHVLIEFYPGIDINEMTKICQTLIKNGYTPIIAHTERFICLNNIYRLVDMRDIGCHFQTNLYSLTEESDERIRETADFLVRGKLLNYIGSDGHRIDHRSPKLTKGLEYLKKTVSTSYYIDLTFRNAKQDFGLNI